MASTSSASRMLSSCTCAFKRSVVRVQRHRIHTRPQLPYDLENGVQPFLSPKALHGTAVEWHQGTLSKLNDLTRGTKYENSSVAQTVVDAAKTPQDALIFSYASEALNNGYFLSCLSSDKTLEKQDFEKALTNNFGSPTSFIDHFSSYAMGMFGGGYVWLVMDTVDNLAVVGTYGAGTVLVQGSVQPSKASELGALIGEESKARQPISSIGKTSTSAGSSTTSTSNSQSSHRSFSSSAASARMDGLVLPEQSINRTTSALSYLPKEMGSNRNASVAPPREHMERFKSIHPLLCLSLHPHVYINDYGICGKEEYIRNFWGNVDWQRCQNRYSTVQEAYNRQSISYRRY